MVRCQVVHVAECPAILPPNKLVEIPHPGFSLHIAGQVKEGYGIDMPTGLRLIVELDAPTLDQAVDVAAQISMTFVGLVCFAAGVRYGRPFPVLALQRLEDSSRYLYRQYFYDAIPVSAGHAVPLDALEDILVRLSQMPDGKDKDRIALAVRWYTTGIGEGDLVNRFLSYFIALEAIGPPLSAAFHKTGELATCETCGWEGIKGTAPTKAEKQKRAPHRAGMQHILSLAEGDTGLYSRLCSVRNDMFHGLRNLDQLVDAVRANVRLLETAVGRGILTLLAATGDGHEMTANEPLHDERKLHAVWEGTIVNLSDDLVKTALYRQELFSIEVRDSQASVTEEGAVAIKGPMSLSGPELTVADMKPPRFLPVEGIEWDINTEGNQPRLPPQTRGMPGGDGLGKP